MTNSQLESEIDGLLQKYADLGDYAAVIVRQLRKIPKADTRTKLIGELRNIDGKRIELLNQIDDLSK